MSVNGIGAVGGLSSTPLSTTTVASGQNPNNQLGQQAFLQLLVAQLQYQDPMQPMNNQQFLAEMAQFQTLTQMTAIQSSLQSLTQTASVAEGSALIGKTVTVTDPTSGQPVTGVVTGVSVQGGNALLQIGGQQVPVSGLNQIA